MTHLGHGLLMLGILTGLILVAGVWVVVTGRPR